MLNGLPRLYFNQVEVDGIRRLLDSFQQGAFSSPYRSTVPLVSLVKDDWPILEGILNSCMRRSEYALHFEYQVKPAGVPGNASHTDAMAVASDAATAIEAKWTEPRYETVASRLKNRVAQLSARDPGTAKQVEASQRAVIEAWFKMLTPFATRPITFDLGGDVVYQVLHRAASAAATSKAPYLIYLHFEPSPPRSAASEADYVADLANLFSLMGKPANFPFYVATIPANPTSAFEKIAELEKGREETDLKVREAIVSNRLFEFGTPSIKAIS